MIIERRYYDYRSILSERNFKGAGIISFGSEACMNRIPDSQSLNKLLQICKKEKIIAKCVFPRVDEFSICRIDEIMQILKSANQHVQVVINDIGCMQYAKGAPDHVQFHLGRQMTRSIVDCPWYKNVIEAETDEIKKELLQLPFYFQEKLELLHEYGIRGLELNSIFGVEESISVLNQLGWILSVHLDEYLLTCGKNCISKRILGNELNCDACIKKISLKPIRKWKNSMDTNDCFNEDEQGLLSGMYVRGKAVYLPQKSTREEILENKDICIGIESV